MLLLHCVELGSNKKGKVQDRAIWRRNAVLNSSHNGDVGAADFLMNCDPFPLGIEHKCKRGVQLDLFPVTNLIENG